MKKNIKIPVLALLFISNFSCNKDDTSLYAALTQGVWVVTHFSEDNDNETQHFNGYEFHFDPGGRVAATNGNTSVYGTWSDGGDDSKEQLILSFGNDPFDELDEDWHVLEQTATRVRLQHISGGNGGADLLTLERI